MWSGIEYICIVSIHRPDIEFICIVSIHRSGIEFICVVSIHRSGIEFIFIICCVYTQVWYKVYIYYLLCLYTGLV